MILRAAAAALCALFLIPTPAVAAPASSPAAQQAEAVFRKNADGTVEHLASGFVFPRQLASLTFVDTRAFTSDDVMARFGSHGPDDGVGWLDLFVYPAAGTIDAEAAEVGGLIVKNYGATPVPAPRPLPPQAADARVQWFEGKIGDETIITGFVLARRGGWSVKVRATSPAAAGSAGIARLLDGIDAIGWSWVPALPPGDPDRVVVQR